MQSLDDIFDQLRNGKKVKIDNRTSEEIISDTIEMWQKCS